MTIACILLALFPLFLEHTIAGRVYAFNNNNRRVHLEKNTANFRRPGNPYVVPRYRASFRTSIRRCSYGGYSRKCCAGWSRNRDGSCSPICANNCSHGRCVGPDMCKCDKGYIGESCSQDLNECGLEPQPCDHRCINTQGSFQCHCEEGYVLLHGNRTCARDDRCYPGRCSYGCVLNNNEVICVCPPGLRLTEDGYHCKAAECESLGYECHQNAYCGYGELRPECICSEGYWGNGKMCTPVHHDECAEGTHNCDENAVCINEPGSFRCECLDGYHGNGEICIMILKPDIANPFVNLTVLVLAAEPTGGDPILSSAFVRTFVYDENSESGTREHRRARTADDGMAVLECPHNESVIVTASNADYLVNSVTFRCNLRQTNVVTLPLHKPYEDTTYVYRPESPQEFGFGNETLNERYSAYFPEDSFAIPENRKVQLLFRSVNVSLTSELQLVPEMIACIPRTTEQPGRGNVGAPPPFDYDVDIRPVETYGAMELTVIDQERRRAPVFKSDKKMILTFPIQKLPADLAVGDKVPAWTFKFESGCWEKDGEGVLVNESSTGNLVWRYEASHFSWWAAGRVKLWTSCVNVRTCYDKGCNHPAPDTLVRIFGEDYGFQTFRYTNMEGQTCVQFPYGRTVELSSPCTSEAIEVRSTEYPSFCNEGRFEIPNVPDYQQDQQDSCREDVLMIPEYHDECAEGTHNCDENAECINETCSFRCECLDGYHGNGEICILIDQRTCDDNPCSPHAECIPIDPDDLNFLLPSVQLFECGPCPEEYEGDGYNCTLKLKEALVLPFVNLTVLVLAAEPTDGDPILSSAFVRTFVSDPTSESGTREHRRARTADNGMAILECPHNESIIVTANDADYFANSVTFRCNIDQTNVVTLPLHKPYEDTIYVYHPDSPREFGVGNETLNERFSTYFPEDSFAIPDKRRVQLLFRSVNVSVTSELELAPEMIACIPKPPDIDIRAIETYGAVELTVIDLERRRYPPFKSDKKMISTFPIQKLPADLAVGDKVPAWTFKFGSGCWEEDGEGELVIDESTGNLVWRYEVNHFSWWAAGRVNPRTSCVTVRTCYDQACSRPAPDTLIRIFGKDYGFETFRYTDTGGERCVQFPYGRTVELSSPCTGEAIEVESTENPSSCAEGRSEIPKVPVSQMEETQDSCREVVLVIPEYERSCPQPEAVHNNLSLDKNMNRDSYPYTDVVHYSCSNPGDDITTHGLGNRVCTRCYSWTGNLMCEAAEDGEPSYY